MTGFGRAEDKNEKRQCAIEIKSVNSRYRDISFRMPITLNALEPRLRGAIQDRLSRGKIDVTITLTEFGGSNKAVVLNEDLANGYMEALRRLCRLDTWVEPIIDLSLVANLPEVITVEEKSPDAEELWGMVGPILEEALAQLCESRAIEGGKMKRDILLHAGNAQRLIDEIDELAPVAVAEGTANLRDRIQAALQEVPVDEGMLLTEVAILSDKLAIDEEVARLKSHMQRFYELVEEDEPIGRKLDFLIQELNRETNTIGSKTNTVGITNKVVDLKSEFEKIREQVQNIE